MQQQLDATQSYFRFSEVRGTRPVPRSWHATCAGGGQPDVACPRAQEIAQARRQDAERLQSAEERFETVVHRLNDMEQAFTAVAAADDTPSLSDHKVRTLRCYRPRASR